jgi:putative endonuclease
MRTQPFVYIMASTSRVLYIGVTGNLPRRWLQHQSGDGYGFTQRYNVRHLVFAEPAAGMTDAIRREKQLKRWRRERKIALIRTMNPEWRDLARDWGWYEMLQTWQP